MSFELKIFRSDKIINNNPMLSNNVSDKQFIEIIILHETISIDATITSKHTHILAFESSNF